MDINGHVRTNRKKLLPFSLGLLAFTVILIWMAFVLSHSIPPRTIVMTTYPEGSLNAELAARYREVLARNGINLKLVPSAGAVESLARLRDSKSDISIALIPGGITTSHDAPELISLGTLFYQPLWIFSRGRDHQDHEQMRGLRISIGPEGSSSRALSLKLLGRAGRLDAKSTTLLSLTPSESADKLIRGEIDVAIFLDAWESPAVQQLLKNKDINLESIQRADAFVSLYPYLNKLTLPAGVVDMAEPRPPTDIALVATKSSLVVRKEVHPTIQYLLLQAAVEIHSTPGMFHGAGRFPAPESIDLPLSDYASQFYKTGVPFLQRNLPFWLAAVLEQPIVLIIPLLAIFVPFFRLAPAIYDWLEKRRVYRLYSELKRLEDEMFLARPSRPSEDFIGRLDGLKARASRLSLPMPFEPLVYQLRLHIELVRDEAQKLVRPNGVSN